MERHGLSSDQGEQGQQVQQVQQVQQGDRGEATGGDGEGPPVTAYMTHEEARRLHGVHLSAIYFAIGRGDLTTAEVLGKTVLTRESVMAWTPRKNARRRKGTGAQD